MHFYDVQFSPDKTQIPESTCFEMISASSNFHVFSNVAKPRKNGPFSRNPRFDIGYPNLPKGATANGNGSRRVPIRAFGGEGQKTRATGPPCMMTMLFRFERKEDLRGLVLHESCNIGKDQMEETQIIFQVRSR